MATWITHLRLAENLLKSGFAFEIEPFMAGNLAPDSGIPNEDWSAFDPPKRITHFQDDVGMIFPEAFFEIHFAEKRHNEDAKAFCVGYYCHLITDVEWLKLLQFKEQQPDYAPHAERLAKEPQFVWEIKRDWYDLDFLYLRDHPGWQFFQQFTAIKEVADYLPFFPPTAFTRQLHHIQNFYVNQPPTLDRPFIYLKPHEIEAFIDTTTLVLSNTLKQKGLE